MLSKCYQLKFMARTFLQIVCVSTHLTFTLHCTYKKRKEDQDIFLVDPAFVWTWFCSHTHQCYIWVTTLISMRRQVCKRHGLQKEDQALHIQCETLKIINEEIAEGTAYTRTITNELFWEWQWWRLEDEKKVKIFHQLQTSIWKTRRWSKQRKNKIYIFPRKPASSHTIHHVTTLTLLHKAFLHMQGSLLESLVWNGYPFLSEHKRSADHQVLQCQEQTHML